MLNDFGHMATKALETTTKGAGEFLHTQSARTAMAGFAGGILATILASGVSHEVSRFAAISQETLAASVQTVKAPVAEFTVDRSQVRGNTFNPGGPTNG